MANLKFDYDKNEYNLYNEELKNFPPYQEYVKDLPHRRKSAIKTELIQFCLCHHSGISELMKDGETARERIDSFEDFLYDNGYVLGTVESRIATVKSFYRFNGIDVPKGVENFDSNLREEIRNSESFNYFLTIKTRTKKTNDRYLSDLTDYCDFNKMGIDDLIDEANKEEEAGIRKNKRKLKTRLINFRGYLRSKGYAEKHVKTRFRNVKSFYKQNEIELPFIPKDTKQYDRQLRHDEVPSKEDIKRAIETTTNLRNRAIFLFMATSGSASAETRTFTVREWILGTKEFHGETEDIQRALKKMNGEMEYIPVFPIVRQKKNLDYYTCITPEANQYIVNYLMTRENLTLDDYVFDISENSLGDAYRYVNDKLGWGRVKGGKIRYFSSHQMRRFNFNVLGIENKSFAYLIEGRKFGATSEAYFVRDPNKIRAKYREFVNDLTIFQKYEIKDINSKEYLEMQEQLKKKDDEIRELELKLKEREISEKAIEDRLATIEMQLPHLSNTNPVLLPINSEPMNIGLMVSIENVINYHKGNDDNPQWVDAKIQSLNNRELIALKDIAYDLINRKGLQPQDFLEIEPLVIKAIFEMENNPQLVKESIDYHNARSLNQAKITRYIDLLYTLLARDYLTDEERAEWEAHLKWEKENGMKAVFNSESRLSHLADTISLPFCVNVDDYLLEEITEEFVMADIENFYKSKVIRLGDVD